jgi:hypothetical protein
MMVDTTCSWSRQQRTVRNYMKEQSLSASDESLVRRVARIKPYRQDDDGIFRRIFAVDTRPPWSDTLPPVPFHSGWLLE